MTTFRGLSADQFYNLRDARTLLSVAGEVLANSRLTLSIDEGEAETFEGQVAFLTLLNVSARWCRNIRLDAPRVDLHPGLSGLFSGNLLDAAIAVASDADPFGGFENSVRGGGIHVHVGTMGRAGAFSVCGRGWLAYGGSMASRALLPQNPNPLGALMAACLGAAHALRSAIGDADLYDSFVLSLWNLESGLEAKDGPALSSVELGKILIVGLGAVGSSIAYALSFLPVVIDFTDLVDEDRVDYPNLNRGPLFTASDVDSFKVRVVERLHRLRIRHAIEKKVEDAVDGGLRISDYDLVIPAANVPNARETVMQNVPSLMISASTGTQWDAYRQRHLPLIDDCLVCRFPSNRPVPKLACAEGSIAPQVEIQDAAPQTGALPFLSLASAAMAAAEIAKLAFPADFEGGVNRAVLSLRGEEPLFMLSQRTPRIGCSFCTSEPIFKALLGQRRFAPLSTVGAVGIRSLDHSNRTSVS